LCKLGLFWHEWASLKREWKTEPDLHTNSLNKLLGTIKCYREVYLTEQKTFMRENKLCIYLLRHLLTFSSIFRSVISSNQFMTSKKLGFFWLWRFSSNNVMATLNFQCNYFLNFQLIIQYLWHCYNSVWVKYCCLINITLCYIISIFSIPVIIATFPLVSKYEVTLSDFAHNGHVTWSLK
jgi:hypothetical protein